jgi:hypothetical protein
LRPTGIAAIQGEHPVVDEKPRGLAEEMIGVAAGVAGDPREKVDHLHILMRQNSR